MILFLIIVIVILIGSIFLFNPGKPSKKEVIITLIGGVAIATTGEVIGTLINKHIDEQAQKERAINYLTMTRDHYSNFSQDKNAKAYVSRIPFAMKEQDKSFEIDSLEYTFLSIPDLYNRLINDETIFKFLSDDFKIDVLRFQEKNQIDKLKFENAKNLEDKMNHIFRITSEFGEQIRILEIEIDYQLGKLNEDQCKVERKKANDEKNKNVWLLKSK